MCSQWEIIAVKLAKCIVLYYINISVRNLDLLIIFQDHSAYVKCAAVKCLFVRYVDCYVYEMLCCSAL